MPWETGSPTPPAWGGMEALGEIDAADLAGGVPDQRQDGILMPTGSALSYRPANQ